MPAYLSPGVFVEEQDTGTRPIEAVGTSTAGFVGTAPLADVGKGDVVPVDNWAQFARLFIGDKGKFSKDYWTPVDLTGLYWHIVDLIWIFLFPLLYLIS